MEQTYTTQYGWVSDDPVADEQMNIMYPEGPEKAEIIDPDENAYYNSLEVANLSE